MANQNYKPGFFGFSLFPPVIKFLLISNGAVYLLQHFFLPALKVGSVSVYKVFFQLFALQPLLDLNAIQTPISGPFFPWQLITYMFMHGSFGHLFFNMFALWMFGVELENIWGSKKFLIYYFITGIGAGLANILIAPLFADVAPTVGASGAVYGILVAFGMLFPNRNIYIYFLIPIKAKYLVILYMVIEVFYVGSQADSGIAHIAHLGGAVVGFIYILSMKNKLGFNFVNFKDKSSGSSGFFNFGQKSQTGRSPFKQNKTNVVNAEFMEINTDKADIKKEEEEKQRISQSKIDTILDKLAEKGYQSLTEEEKKVLFEESKKIR
jgi:membrane associated rhomboid family serine protease